MNNTTPNGVEITSTTRRFGIAQEVHEYQPWSRNMTATNHDDEIVAEFVFDNREFMHAWTASSGGLFRRLAWGILILTFLAILFDLTSGVRRPAYEYALLPFLLSTSWAGFRWTGLRRFSKAPFRNKKFRYVFSSDRLKEYVAPDETDDVPWSIFKRARKAKTGILVYTEDPKTDVVKFLWIPARAFTSADDFHRLVDLVRSKVPSFQEI